MKYRLLLLLIPGLFIFSSCKKEKENSTVVEENTGTIVDGIFTPAENAPYLPLKKGNEWVYNRDEAYTVTIEDTTTINDTVYYREVTSTPTVVGNAESAIRYENGAYYRKQEVYGVDADYNLTSELREIMILDENAQLGESWSYMITVGSNITNYVYTVEAKGVPVEYNDITYSDAIQISLDINSNLDFSGVSLEDVFNQNFNFKTTQGFTRIASQDYIYIKGVGLAEQKSSSLFDSFIQFPSALNMRINRYSVDY